MLQQQVNAKLIWGARDTEVLEWLEERHGIRDSAAARLLVDAHRAKQAAVRRKALLYAVFSIPGMLFAIVYFGLQAKGGFIIIGYGSVLVFLVGVSSVGILCRSLFRLFSGHTDGAVD
jgi:hypothetical protein